MRNFRASFALLGVIGVIGVVHVAALSAQEAISPSVRHAVQAKATNRYPLREVQLFGRDSVLLVFEDSSYTAAAVRSGTWMFGPPVTAAEADSCPAEKVLGRKIARVFWRHAGRGIGIRQVVVRVRGTRDMDRFSFYDMYYYRRELEVPWAGDSGSR